MPTTGIVTIETRKRDFRKLARGVGKAMNVDWRGTRRMVAEEGLWVGCVIWIKGCGVRWKIGNEVRRVGSTRVGSMGRIGRWRKAMMDDRCETMTMRQSLQGTNRGR
jgi:hypothetical protein